MNAETNVAAWDRRLAAPMFAASLWSLVCLAGVLHLHESVEDYWVFLGSVVGALAVYPAFWMEAVLRYRQGSARWKWCLLYCALPPLRMTARDHATGELVWLPRFGWRPVNRSLRSDVEAALNVPMLIVALAVLPVVLVEYFWAEQIATDPQLSRMTALATAVIWLAFCTEFIVMASLAEHKLAYCKQHWLDLAIILLPLIAFLRVLRLGRLLRLNALAKTSRMYKLRGVLMRGYRALLLIKAIDRLLNGSPEKRLARLRRRLVEQEALLEELREEIRQLEAVQTTVEPAADAA